MNSYPIFLLPNKTIMMTAKIEGDKIIILKETPFPSNKRYSISEKGLAVCLDKKNEMIIYGYLKENGEIQDVKYLPFPEMISPTSICIIKEHLILGGKKNHSASESEMLATYDIREKKFKSIEVPPIVFKKSIDDLLVDHNKVIAVDNVVEPKFILEYNFEDLNNPHLIDLYTLPLGGTYESIKKGTMNQKYIALFSTTYGRMGGGTNINIFRKGDFSKHLSLSQFNYFLMENLDTYDWKDFVLLPKHNVLLLSSLKDGIGVYQINENKFDEKSNEDSDAVKYITYSNKEVIKILIPPQSPDYVLIILKEHNTFENESYSYALQSIEGLLSKCT